MNRKQFIHAGLLTGGAALLGSGPISAQAESTVFSAEQIDEFVSAAHGDFRRTKKILDENPLILNCASQLAKGDFETALGGASHMGRRDIADLLVEKGARTDLFNLTFLGFNDFVKELVTRSPQYLRSYGPHGFTLLHHAKVGKHVDLANWLQGRGLEEDLIEVFAS